MFRIAFRRCLACSSYSRDTQHLTMPRDFKSISRRREWLTASILAGGAIFLGAESLCAAEFGGALVRFRSKFPRADSISRRQTSWHREFVGEPRVPMDAVFDSEFDGRLYTDLSSLKSGRACDSYGKIFHPHPSHRNCCDTSKPWSIRMGSAGRETDVTYAGH